MLPEGDLKNTNACAPPAAMSAEAQSAAVNPMVRTRALTGEATVQRTEPSSLGPDRIVLARVEATVVGGRGKPAGFDSEVEGVHALGAVVADEALAGQ